MVQINFGSREVSCKVVFYGPGMSGKTTNLEIIHQKAPKETVGEMVSIATETDRTLYFDFLPLDLGQVAGMRTKFQLYTVPGQIYYNATRKLVLQGVDGVIFVADSNPAKMAENLESLQNLRDNLTEMGLTIDQPDASTHIPVVIQYNKRDLPNASSVAELNAQMNPKGWPTVEACARDGRGVFATLKEISKLVIEKLNKEHGGNRRRSASTQSNLPPQPTQPQPQAPAAQPSFAPPAPPRTPTPARQPAVSAHTGAIATPARPAPAQPSARPAQRTATTNAPVPAPIAPQDQARSAHLNKPKPMPLTEGIGQPSPEMGRTEPRLKQYRSGGSSLASKMLIALIFVIIALIIVVGLVIFVKPVREAIRPSLPAGMQRMLMDEEPAPINQPSTPSTPRSATSPGSR